jgi:hypothetical protein
MRTLWRGLLMCGLWFPLVAFGQQLAVEVLQTTLSYRGLQSFWCTNDSAEVLLSRVVTQGHLTSSLKLRRWERTIPMRSHSDSAQPYELLIRRFKINTEGSKAKVKFTYHDRVKARLTLRLEQGIWHVTGAWIRQKRPCDPNQAGSRFVWQF